MFFAGPAQPGGRKKIAEGLIPGGQGQETKRVPAGTKEHLPRVPGIPARSDVRRGLAGVPTAGYGPGTPEAAVRGDLSLCANGMVP